MIFPQSECFLISFVFAPEKIIMQYSYYEPFCIASPLSYLVFMCRFKVNMKMIEKYQIVRHYLVTTKNLSFESALNRSSGEIPNIWKETTSHL